MKELTTYKLKLTTLSPVHIGTGEDFEPTNYVIDAGTLYEFDEVIFYKSLSDLDKKALDTKLGSGWLEIIEFYKTKKEEGKKVAIYECLVSKEIQDKYKVNQQLLTSINRGVTHRRPGLEYPIIKTSKYHCSEEAFEQICYLLKNSLCTCAEIGQYFGFSGSTIKAINSGRNHYTEGINYPIRNFRGKANSQSVEAILAKRSTETIGTSLEM